MVDLFWNILFFRREGGEPYLDRSKDPVVYISSKSLYFQNCLVGWTNSSWDPLVGSFYWIELDSSFWDHYILCFPSFFSITNLITPPFHAVGFSIFLKSIKHVDNYYHKRQYLRLQLFQEIQPQFWWCAVVVQYYNAWVSLIGTLLCIAVMFLISWWTALVTFFVVITLYLYVSYRKPGMPTDYTSHPLHTSHPSRRLLTDISAPVVCPVGGTTDIQSKFFCDQTPKDNYLFKKVSVFLMKEM